MSLVRHIAGIPTATEQRCVRCCEVIRDVPPDYDGIVMAWWPGRAAFTGEGKRSAVDCAPYDPQADRRSKSAQEWKDEIHSVAGIL